MNSAAQPSVARIGALKHESAGWNRGPHSPALAARWINPSSGSAAVVFMQVRAEAATLPTTGV